jgi:hypothetical protein
MLSNLKKERCKKQKETLKHLSILQNKKKISVKQKDIISKDEIEAIDLEKIFVMCITDKIFVLSICNKYLLINTKKVDIPIEKIVKGYKRSIPGGENIRKDDIRENIFLRKYKEMLNLSMN